MILIQAVDRHYRRDIEFLAHDRRFVAHVRFVAMDQIEMVFIVYFFRKDFDAFRKDPLPPNERFTGFA